MARILIVDDEPDVLAVLARMLEAEGHAVKPAGSAEEGLELLGAGSYDLVVMDIDLPRMTGFEAIQRFSERSAAPILLMSGHADESFREDAKALGARGLLGKPFDSDELMKSVREALR